jgi:exonuclease III
MNQEEITIINLYVPNASAPNFIEHTLKYLKQHIDPNAVVMGDFNTPLLITDRSYKQNINKEILELSDSIDLMELTDIYRGFHPATAQYTFFLATHELSLKEIIS